MTQPPTITTIPERRAGESDRDYERRFLAWVNGDDVRTKTDLRDWTGSGPMHLDNDKGAK